MNKKLYGTVFTLKKKDVTNQNFEQTSDKLEEENLDFPIKKMSKKKKILITTISILLVLVISTTIFAFSFYYVKKDYETIASFVNISEPIQEEITGGITKQVGDYNVTFDFKAKYTLVGRVVNKHYYPPYKIANRLSNYDFGIAWGVLSDSTYDELIKYRNNGQRTLVTTYKNSLVDKLVGKDFLNSYSNNHMIHADKRVLKLLRNVKEGQYIKIIGYLSYVTYKNNNGYGTWNSSLTRTDRGDGACEVIYVTNIIWLKTN